jgi:hypothetical protein
VPPKRKILWVEDSARFDLASLLGPIYASRRYDLTLAENATAASEYLLRRQFDAILVDIRLPPGSHSYWLNIFKSAGADRHNAKLGLALLGWLFGVPLPGAPNPTGNGHSMPKLPTWPVTSRQVGVFSVENRQEIGHDLDRLGVTVMHEKRPGLPDTILLEIVSEVLAQSDQGGPAGPGGRPDRQS